LSDFERECLAFSTMVAIGAIEHMPLDEVAELLEAAAAEGHVAAEGDRYQVAMLVYGCPVVVTTRVRLRALAHPDTN